MQIEAPEVHVTGDPLVVVTFVALFAGVLIVALILAVRHSTPEGN